MWFQIVPQWLAKERWRAMQVHDQILKSTVFIGYKDPRGEFLTEGTGFIFNIPDADLMFGYTATCAHVVRASAQVGTEYERKVCVSFNTKEGGTRVFETDIAEWTFHKDNVDACLLGVKEEWDRDNALDTGPLDMSSLANKEVYEQSCLSLGDDLFIAGLWVGRPGQRKNLPIVRVANLAAKPLGGTSGAPLFLHTTPFRSMRGATGRITDTSAILPYLIIGMIQGSHAGNYLGEFVGEDGVPNRISDSQFNAGISIAIPIGELRTNAGVWVSGGF
jgi:hypothetical protein